MPATKSYELARQHMVESQLIPNDIHSDAVLDAMRAIPREDFVPDAMKGSAYIDEELPVGRGRYLLEPVLFAHMLELANIQKTDKVLDVGCATGYSTLVLCHLAKQVVAVEEQMELAEQARQQLNHLQCDAAEVITSPLVPGHPAGGPYDVILINGAVEVIPDALVDQLAEGGRMVFVKLCHSPAKSVAGLGRLCLGRKIGGQLAVREVRDASSPLLAGFEKKRSFVF